MQESVNPVDAHIGKKEEGDHAKDQSCPTWRTGKWKWAIEKILNRVTHLTIKEVLLKSNE